MNRIPVLMAIAALSVAACTSPDAGPEAVEPAEADEDDYDEFDDLEFGGDE